MAVNAHSYQQCNTEPKPFTTAPRMFQQPAALTPQWDTQRTKQGTEVHSPGSPPRFLIQGNVYNPGFISVVSPTLQLIEVNLLVPVYLFSFMPIFNAFFHPLQ